ncbi:TPA: phage baseplate protein [Klebsiella michiganensis]|uniref:phage baseplate protein n=1 Tax=Klebsiella sp. FR21MBA2675 TaxID=3381300 RepID=UPI003A979CB1
MDILSTLFQQNRRKIGVMVPSVVISEKHSDTLEITEHPVERPTSAGAGLIADHAYRRPSEVVMNIGFAGGGSLLDLLDTRNLGLYTPLNPMGPKEVYAELLKMQQERQLLDVTTGKRLYKNMLIRALEVTTDRTTENVLSATVTLREVIITQTKSIKVADKAEMKYGVETSAVINTGTKTPIPQNNSLLTSGTDLVKSILGIGAK